MNGGCLCDAPHQVGAAGCLDIIDRAGCRVVFTTSTAALDPLPELLEPTHHVLKGPIDEFPKSHFVQVVTDPVLDGLGTVI